MSYHGIVLLMAGYQADEAHIVKQYRAIVDKYVQPVLASMSMPDYASRSRISEKYPDGSLWILNRVNRISSRIFPIY